MLIDFHTHFFPDKIAKESVEKLSRTGGIPYHGDGTLGGLLSFMEQDGVTLSVNQPVATRPGQVVGINRKMVELNERQSKVLCFGAMHPDFPGFEEELAFLAENGIRGIKMHPEYQQFYPEDARLFKLYEACAKHRMIVLFHAGVDIAYREVHCTPKGVRQLRGINGFTLVLAHMGGYRMWDEVEEYLVGTEFYFDLACCSEMDDARLKRIITGHGSEKILFATDFPWDRARVITDKVNALGLPETDRENIFFKNACRLLHIS